jgi:hypothetical protein
LKEDIFRTGITQVSSFDRINWREFFTKNRGDAEIVVGMDGRGRLNTQRW